MGKISVIIIILLLSSCSITKNGLIEEAKYGSKGFYARHFAYSVLYSEENKQPAWVAYQLLSSELESNNKRVNKFIEDPLIPTKTANNTDYEASGYDKGHIAPTADMLWNEQAMRESFYFSNISPQLPAFNRGVWKKLENRVRYWAIKYESVYIISGPIFSNTDKVIGNNKVTIPTQFFKTILIYNDSIKQGIGFVFPHKKCEDEIFEYAVSIDKVEEITGNNLYYLLPNRYEKEIEKRIDFKFWAY